MIEYSFENPKPLLFFFKIFLRKKFFCNRRTMIAHLLSQKDSKINNRDAQLLSLSPAFQLITYSNSPHIIFIFQYLVQ